MSKQKLNISFRTAQLDIALSSWQHFSKSLKTSPVACALVALTTSMANHSPACAQYNTSDSVHKRTSSKVLQAKPAAKSIMIPGCESANKVPRPAQAPTDNTLQVKKILIQGAKVCKTSRSENKFYLTFQGILGDVVESKNADVATRNWLQQFPRVLTYEIDLPNNEQPTALDEGSMIDLELKQQQKIITHVSHDEFPSISERVDATTITSINRSSVPENSQKWLILAHLRNYDMAGDYVYSDGTIISFESVNPQIATSGRIGASKLAYLKSLINKANFNKLSTSAAIPIYGGEYISNSKGEKISIDSAPPAKEIKFAIPKELAAKSQLELSAARDLYATLANYHSLILANARIKICYTEKRKKDEIGPPFYQQTDSAGKIHNVGTNTYSIATEFPNIPGLSLSQIGPEGLLVYPGQIKDHKSLLNNMNLNVTHQYWKQDGYAYKLELRYSLLPTLAIP